MFMMGCLTLQMWRYFEDHGVDSRGTKAFVVILFLCSAFQCATDFQLMYDAFITGYGRILYFNKYGWTFYYEPAWTALIAALAQGFFLRRCWVVTKSWWVLVAGSLGIALSLASGIAVTAGLIHEPYYTSTSQVLVEVTVWLIASAVTDLGISIILKDEDWVQKYGKSILHVYKSACRINTHSKLQEKTLSRIVRITFETAALTSVIATVDLLLYIAMGKQNTIHLAFQLIVGKTYNHSVMVTLLSRTKTRSEFDSNSGGRQGHTDSLATKPAGGITVTRTQIRVADHVEYPMKSIAREEEDLDVDTNSAKILRMTDDDVVDETSHLIPSDLDSPPTVVFTDHQRIQERLVTIVRAKERKMVNVNSQIPFNLHNRVLTPNTSLSRSVSLSTAHRDAPVAVSSTFDAREPLTVQLRSPPSPLGSGRNGSHSKSRSISLTRSQLEREPREPSNPILSVRLVNTGQAAPQRVGRPRHRTFGSPSSSEYTAAAAETRSLDATPPTFRQDSVPNAAAETHPIPPAAPPPKIMTLDEICLSWGDSDT
ncbi:hypothetical protein B0H15DRAFT_953532 [Mycena belliarum]|uniref:DUF6534 domain-containing protein n=1 Tax=Mycena belliarum TaxID=1033014 RepID=A0AAD6TUX8_9AGAR|nr:hypothetical protein B0H15DRAFT_953532 [Mycena belliae]